MTAQNVKVKASVKTLAISALSAFAFVIFFIEAPVIIERMKSGLVLCGNVIIPSLFPFMVLSEILILARIDRLFEMLLGGLFEKLFGVSRSACSALILGLLCGFPVGTKIAYSLYEKGSISRDELSHLLAFCNIQSSAFIINTVGISLLSSRRAGVFLYVSQIISLIAVGIIYPKLFPRDRQAPLRSAQETPPKKRGFAAAFTGAVKSSVSGILSVCGFVLFFYVLCGIIIDIGGKLDLPAAIPLLITSMLEMSCGCVESAHALTPDKAFYACAMILGFSGISLHFQITSLCADAQIKYGRFFIIKIITAILAGAVAVAFNFIFKIFV